MKPTRELELRPDDELFGFPLAVRLLRAETEDSDSSMVERVAQESCVDKELHEVKGVASDEDDARDCDDGVRFEEY